MNELTKDFSGSKEFLENTKKVYENKGYKEFALGVLATDQIDKQNQIITVEALKQMENQINTFGMPLKVHHDPRIHQVGEVLQAKLFKSDDGTKNFLFGVSATYAEDFYKPLPKLSEIEAKTHDITCFSEELVKVTFNDYEISREIIEGALAEAPSFVRKSFEEVTRKAADPIIILSFAVPAFIAFPFIKKYMEKQGENFADNQKKFIGWVINKFTKKIKKKTLYQFTSPYNDCRVDFNIETDKPEELLKAFEVIQEASQNALLLISQLEEESPKELVYVYDHEKTNKWLPSYLKTENGTIYTDQPYLMALEHFGGLSVQAAIK